MIKLRNLRIVSLSLFIFSLLGILGTLIISNLLVTYKISFYNFPFKYTNIDPIACNKENNFCKNFEVFFNTQSEKLNDCRIKSYRIDVNHDVDCEDCKGERIPANIFFNTFFDGNKFIGSEDEINILRYYVLGGEKNWKNFQNDACIINSKLYKYYLNFPSFFNSLTKIVDQIKRNEKYEAGHTIAIMPYFYGETSISNIAKRFPLNYFFKFFMIITSFLIFIYWRLYNKFFETITNQKKIKIFYLTGALSGLFLFLHVVFLGIEFEASYIKKLKRLILLLFIFCEIFAQTNLVINLYSYHEKIKDNINSFYLDLKKYLIVIILITFVIGLVVFLSIDLGSTFNNTVEWNFFTFLIFFYLFSYLMWKKINLGYR